MKVLLEPTVTVRRGGPVQIGNVYTNPHGRAFYKLVVGIVPRQGNRPWNNVVMLHVDVAGQIVGSANQPETYVSNHQDLIGRCSEMPTLKIEWLKPGEN